jgi:hypothetical protein
MAEYAENHEHAHLNAMTIVAMFGAIEGLAEGARPDLRRWIDEELEAALGEFETRVGEIPRLGALDPHMVEDRVRQALAAEVERVRERLSTVPTRLDRHPPVERWESAFAEVGLGPSPERPLPEGLREALNEVGALRNLILHRRGRVDEKFRRGAPKARWRKDGDLVRVTATDYRRYVAALRTYAGEIGVRLGLFPTFDFTGWQENYVIGD